MKRWAGSHLWHAMNRAQRNRVELYRGMAGLRILTFHHTRSHELREVRRIVRWCRDRLPLASPADADAVFDGRWPHAQDRVLLTFDDGFESNYAAASWLADEGIAAIFFIVPSLVDRTVDEYLAHHARHGVRAHAPLAPSGARGLYREQVREMAAMGHRIGAHNFAHRDLGLITKRADLNYEIQNALDGVAELTGTPCLDFAIGFGQPENVSSEAIEHLLASCPRVYSCHRGLNVPGVTPRFALRHAWESDHPFNFTLACLDGAGDHHLASRAREMHRRVGPLPAAATTVPVARTA